MNKTDQFIRIVKLWNPETDSVNVLKDAITEYGEEWIYNEQICKSIEGFEWAEKYYNKYAFSCVSEHYCVLAIDFEGNCLLCCVPDEVASVRPISELENEFENWIKEQEAENASNKNRTLA